jgi:hypothetical protein
MTSTASSALCHVCGGVRTVKVSRDGRYRPPGFDQLDATCDLRCAACGVVTRHALCFDGPDDERRATGSQATGTRAADDRGADRRVADRRIADRRAPRPEGGAVPASEEAEEGCRDAGGAQWHADVERGLLDARTWIVVGAGSMWQRGFAAAASGRAGYVAGVYAGFVVAHDFDRAESWRSGAKAGEKGDAGSRRTRSGPRH